MESADILEENFPEEDWGEPSALEQKINSRFGEKAAWNAMLFLSVLFAVVLSIGIFVIFPTIAINWLGKWISNSIVLNLCEGIFRIALFVLYIYLISRMKDIQTLFQYHGAEHKTIHCFENGLELTPANAQQFYTLHPRCGTSFLIFVMIISLLLFSFLGWPNVWMRIASRILLIPVIAGLSYEVLRLAGKSDNVIVRVLSYPGLMMQKLTTKEPTDHQLEIAIVALKAVLVDSDAPVIDGVVDTDAKLIVKESEKSEEPKRRPRRMLILWKVKLFPPKPTKFRKKKRTTRPTFPESGMIRTTPRWGTCCTGARAASLWWRTGPTRRRRFCSTF